MIEDMKVARATCDVCRRRHQIVAPRTTLKACLRNEGWKVGPGDRTICPNCLDTQEDEHGGKEQNE